MKKFLKRLITGVLAAAIAYTAVPIDVHAAVLDAAGEAVQSAVGNSIGGEQIADNEKAYFEANVNPAYTGFKEFSLANVLTVKTTLADGSKLPAGYKTIDLLWQYQLQDISHDAFIATYMNSTFLYDLDSESQYFVARANTNMTEGVRTTDAIFAFANNLGEGIDDCIYDYDTGLCYIPKKYYFEIAKNGVYTLGSVQVQLLQIQDSLETTKEISVTINDDKLFSTSVKKTEIEVESISPDTTLKVVDDKDLRSTTADDITIRVNGAAGEREDIYYNEDTGEITIPNGAATINSVQVDINNSAVSRAVRSLFGTDVAHALTTEQMQYVRATDGSELTFKVDNGAGVPKAGDKFWIRVKELYGHEIVTTSCAANMDYSYGLAFDGIVSQEAASQNIKNYTESHTGWANAWSDGLNPDTAVPSGGDEGNSSWIQWFAQLGADNNVFSMNDSSLRNGILFGFALFSPDGIASHGSFSTVDTADGGSRTYSIVENKLAWVPGMCSHIDNYDFRDGDTAPDDGTHYDLNGNEGEYNGRINAKVLKFDDHSNEGYGDVWFPSASTTP